MHKVKGTNFGPRLPPSALLALSQYPTTSAHSTMLVGSAMQSRPHQDTTTGLSRSPHQLQAPLTSLA